MVSSRAVDLEQSGFVLCRSVVEEAGRIRLATLLGLDARTESVVYRSGAAFAARALLDKVPELAACLAEEGLDALASTLLGGAAFPVDAIYFDKNTRANWAVPGHQDRVMPVLNERGEAHRVKEGIAYAELDQVTLARLLALRLHFDATDARRGALAVVPGSHRSGRLTDVQVGEVSWQSYVPCRAEAGDIMALRPLLLHRSSPFQGDGQRRVLHVVYATHAPAAPFRWRVPER